MGSIPEELFFCADLPIVACALALGGAVIIDRPLCYYRIHPANMCSHDRTDIAKVRRDIQVSEFFLNYIPEKLVEFGVAREISAAMLGTIRFEVERLKAQFGVVGHSQVFRTELQRFHAYYQRPNLGYKLFECLVGACALILPPRRFYQLLDWYSRNNFQRFRSMLGKAEPKVSPAFFQRLAVSEHDLRSDRT
jgi:hypothetical protein